MGLVRDLTPRSKTLGEEHSAFLKHEYEMLGKSLRNFGEKFLILQKFSFSLSFIFFLFVSD